MNDTEPIYVRVTESSSTWFPRVSFLLLYLIPIFLIYRAVLGKSSSLQKNVPKHWAADHWPVIGSSLRFFARRQDMMLAGKHLFPTGYFSFFVGAKHVVALSGAEGRQTFFGNKDLSLSQGFVELLTGKLPSATNDADYGLQNLIQPLLALTRSNVLARRLPGICNDVGVFSDGLLAQPVASKAPEWRVTNIYNTVPQLVFKLMHRGVGVTEICDDPKLFHWTYRIYRKFEKTTSNAHIVFPWLYTPSHVWRLFLATRLYLDVTRILTKRKKEKRREDDAMQYLMDKGESMHTIVEFVFTTFVAGLTTTSFTSAWLLLFLAKYPEWRERCRQEINSIVAAHRTSQSQTPNEVLQTLTLQQWESDLPVIAACLRETLRMQLPGAMLRRNGGSADIPIGNSGEVIPAGSYAAYPVADAHMDPALYPDAHMFDPGRYLGSKPKHQEGPHTYLGWGSGRHVCVGMRMAKLMITIISAHMLVNFEFELSDKDGRQNADGLPPWNTNAIRMEVTDTPVYLRYKPVGVEHAPAV